MGTQLLGTAWCKPTQNVSNRYFSGTFRTSSSVVFQLFANLQFSCLSLVSPVPLFVQAYTTLYPNFCHVKRIQGLRDLALPLGFSLLDRENQAWWTCGSVARQDF